MTIAVLANHMQKEELIAKGIPETVKVIWADSLRSLTMVEADAYFDLLFEFDHERTDQYNTIKNSLIFVNSVQWTTDLIGKNFIRINAWPGMLKRDIVELAAGSDRKNDQIGKVFSALNWKYQLVPDVPGMISARILAMIINEAWYTYGEHISSKEEIDTAMRLGTNYPMGPFEWGDLIGLKKIHSLLKALQKTDSRYTIAPALERIVKEYAQ
jgi:3-hydroxybutyryl-CoA dehydrogenase